MPPYKTDTTLRRGTACLSCRKRKLKCDGIRPICGQCNKMNRANSCEYDDRQQKSRTQLLKEQLSVLEKRLKDLEASCSRPSSSPLNLDLTPFGLEAFDESQAGPSSNTLFHDLGSFSTSSPPHSISQSALFHPGEVFLPPNSNASSYSASDPEITSHWDPRTSLPCGAKKYLLEVFMAHKHQCWFYGSMDRFIDSSNHPDNVPHPALINAMYLLSCYYAQSPYYSEMESAFFVQAQHEINAALDSSDRLPDIVQASSLLAIYLYTNNRIMEGYRHTFSGIRLAVGLGLHQIRPPSTGSAAGYPQQPPLIPISPPRDSTELADRIFAFWQVFMVDRSWSVANKFPLALPDKENPQCRILTPWPWTVECRTWEDHGIRPPVQTLLEGPEPPASQGLYMPALKAKAAALFELTSRSKTSSDRNDWFYRIVESAVHRFSSTIPSLAYDRDYFVVQTLMYTSFIHLQHQGIFDLRAFKAANSIVRLIRQLDVGEYQYLDTIISVCWHIASEIFVRALASAGGTENSFGDRSNIVNLSNIGLDILTSALKTLGAFSSLSADLAVKVEVARNPIRIL